MRTLERHKKGILSLAWCAQDSDLLLSAAKDNLVLCWNPNSDTPGGEVGVASLGRHCLVLSRVVCMCDSSQPAELPQ